MNYRHFLAIFCTALALAACNSSSSSSNISAPPTALRGDPAALGNSGPAIARSGSWENAVEARPADYDGVYDSGETFLAMSDGVTLSAKVFLPSSDGGESAAAGPFPCLLTQTGYNKNIPAIPASNDFLIQRGYAHVAVDVRGTGNSSGDWEAFSEREQEDYAEVMDWVANQPWCDGNVGTWGASFMGITQLYTGAHQHPAHKAIFAIVPMADAYRDIVMSGGQVNIGFIPLWMGLVTSLGVVPTQDTASQEGFENYLTVAGQHLVSALTNFQVPTIATVVTGQENNYDNAFWRTRSPIEQIEKISMPTFIVGGLNDIFQRGEPLLYEELKDHTTTKLLIGPWQHVGASSGQGLPLNGVPDLNSLALQWFDRWLKGDENGAEELPNVTQYYYGAEQYATASDWPHPQLKPQRWYLQGDASVADGGLSPLAPEDSEISTTLPHFPLNGVCSTSTSQWTAGLLGLNQGCFADNRANEIYEATFTTEPMLADMAVNGPIVANLWVTTTSPDASVVVRITDVAPDGSSRELTNGLLTASMRGVDNRKSRFIGRELLQPWHPYTADSELPVSTDLPMQLNVEVFPSSFVIKEGHSLRVTIGASDFPHGLPPVPNLVSSALGVLTIYSDARLPSHIVLPIVPVPVSPNGNAGGDSGEDSEGEEGGSSLPVPGAESFPF